MTDTLDRRLQRAAGDVVSHFDDAPIPDLDVTRRRPTTRTSTGLRFVAAAVAIVVVASATAAFLRRDDRVEVAAAPSLEWKSFPYVGSGLDSMIEPLDVTLGDSFAVGGPGFVYVGATGNETDQTVAIAVSSDGEKWRHLTKAEIGTHEGMLDHVASGGNRLIAAGMHGAARPFFWTSTDGIAWDRCNQPVFNGVSTGVFDITELAVVGSTFVMAGARDDGPTRDNDTTPLRGEAAPSDDAQPTATGTAVWWSQDGCRWQMAFPGSGPFIAITHTSEGVAVAVRPEGEEKRFELWTSPDGQTWTLDEGTSAINVRYGLTELGGRYFVGDTFLQATKPGGTTFHFVDNLTPRDSDRDLLGVRAIGPYLFASGHDDVTSSGSEPSPANNPTLWISRDGGDSWEVATRTDDVAFDIVGTSARVLVVTPGATLDDSRIWIGTPAVG